MVDGRRHFEVMDDECVGCNLCVDVCPVEDCITMETLAPARWTRGPGAMVQPGYANWTTHPNNPMAAIRQQFAPEPSCGNRPNERAGRQISELTVRGCGTA